MRIDVLALEGAFDLGLAAVVDTLAVANDLSRAEGARAPFDVRLVGMRARVSTHHGFRVPTVKASPRSRCDVAIVPALGCKTPDTITAALDRADVVDAYEWLCARERYGARVMAACTGTFVLAASTLLDHGTATTTWWLAPLFRKLFPDIVLDETSMVVESGRCVTAGAALAHLDLALWLVRTVSPTLASMVSRYLLIDARPTPAVYAIVDQLAHDDPVVRRFEQWARTRLAEPFQLSLAARASGASARTLARRIKQTLGQDAARLCARSPRRARGASPAHQRRQRRRDRAGGRLRRRRHFAHAVAAEDRPRRSRAAARCVTG